METLKHTRIFYQQLNAFREKARLSNLENKMLANDPQFSQASSAVRTTGDVNLTP